MPKVLVNDGIHPEGERMLKEAGFEVDTTNIPQDELPAKLPNYDVICVRSATKVREALIDVCPDLKIVARGGVGLDNIDVDYAKSKGVAVMNTPAASSQAVAELAFGHFISCARSIYDSNRHMPTKGDSEFKSLKKKYAKGVQLRGATLGVLGFGRIGQEAAKVGLGMGMKVLAVDLFAESATIPVTVGDQTVEVEIKTVPMDEMLAQADFITMHVPFTGKPAISTDEFNKMKDGVIIANAARGGTLDEDALLAALESGKVAAAGLDVFINEPTPRQDILSHPRISVTPHIGASTTQAQTNIGIELAEQIIAHFK